MNVALLRLSDIMITETDKIKRLAEISDIVIVPDEYFEKALGILKDLLDTEKT